jgi:hypothetical protein
MHCAQPTSTTIHSLTCEVACAFSHYKISHCDGHDSTEIIVSPYQEIVSGRQSLLQEVKIQFILYKRICALLALSENRKAISLKAGTDPLCQSALWKTDIRYNKRESVCCLLVLNLVSSTP